MTLREQFDLPAAVDDSAIFGVPHETADGTTVITVARPGGRFRPGLRPLGVVVIHEGESRWVPAVDDTRIALMALLIGLSSATIATLAVLRRPPWPDLSGPTFAALVAQKHRS